MRKDGRAAGQMRPIRIVPNYSKHPHGSALIEYGETRVLCTVFVEEGVPSFLRNSVPAQGWLTAEYSMLPGATSTRTRRERMQMSGRTQEIQRLIGRSLRGAIDLKRVPDMTFNIDCDVLQADGGTRTASVTGAFVALKLAVDKLLRTGRLKANPLHRAVAAVSVGIIKGEIRLDLNYEEDSSADVDMNLVMTEEGQLLEIQGTAEGMPFDAKQVGTIIEIATGALSSLFELQLSAADGNEVEG